jgi:hypothetical protein
MSRSGRQAGEAVANLPLRLAVRVEYTARNDLPPSAERAFPPAPAGSSARARVTECVVAAGAGAARDGAARAEPAAVAAGVAHAGFASELVSLPSGLLAMVCKAIVKLKVLLRVACVRACVCASVRECIYAAWAVREGRRGLGACTSPVRVGHGQCSPQGGVRPYGGVL